MRTTKRFTGQVLARFIREGRGQGQFKLYKPWHRVSRGDPASRGRSHLVMWLGRLRELLSDGELNQQLLATMLPGLEDSREQNPLDLNPSAHPLSAYEHRPSDEKFPGTKQLAREMGIRHPTIKEKDAVTFWVLSTDLVLVLRTPSGGLELLALAYKPAGELTKRNRQLLALERAYWLCRGATWLLITPVVYDSRAAKTLRRTIPWGLGKEAPAECRAVAARLAQEFSWASFTSVLMRVAQAVGSVELAQRALWQAIWRAELPIDLTRGWRPHLPLRIVTVEEFKKFNPLVERRTAWSS